MKDTPDSLFDAIDDGDVTTVARLARAHRSWLELRDEGGLTPLLRAAMHLGRDPGLIGALLESGADATVTTDERETALHLVIDVEGDAGFGDEPLALMRPLVAAGTPLEARAADGLTPLALAVVHGTPDEVAALLQLGADASVQLPLDFESEALAGRTLLGAALGSPEKTEALLGGGADPRATDASGLTAPELAATLQGQAEENDAAELADALGRCRELFAARAALS